MTDLSKLAAQRELGKAGALLDEKNVEILCQTETITQLTAERDALRAECERLRARYRWAANELLVCDYGDNDHAGNSVGWIVHGWRAGEKQRIYGVSIDAAIDDEIARAALARQDG